MKYIRQNGIHDLLHLRKYGKYIIPISSKAQSQIHMDEFPEGAKL